MTTLPVAVRRPAKVIYSRNNPQIRRIRNLHQREHRERTGLFFVEGIRFVAQAVERSVSMRTLLVSPPLLVNRFGRRLWRDLARDTGTPCIEVPPEVFHSVALGDEPQGIGAVVRQRWEPLERIEPAKDLCWIAFDTVQSPGNLGTILRTGDAVGAAGVILLGEAADPHDPATVRATMGTLFSQRLVRTSAEAFFAWAARRGCRVIGTSPSAPTDYRDLSYRAPVVLFMGWERRGLPAEHQARCDAMVRIPMVGRGDSLNLAVATGVLLYEVFNQRRT